MPYATSEIHNIWYRVNVVKNRHRSPTSPLLTVILCQHSHRQYVATLSFRLASFAKHFQKDVFLQLLRR